MLKRTLPWLALVLVGLHGNAHSQSVLHTHTATQLDQQTQPSVALLGDLNGDGHSEWLVGFPHTDTANSDAGEATLFSGIDHSVLQVFSGAGPNARFGTSVTNVGDLDGDGLAEFAIGAAGERAVRLYSGATLGLLWLHAEPTVADFGKSLAAAGDVNGDGIVDLVVGGSGARVLSSATGALVFAFTHPGWNGLGQAVCGLGDVNADGFEDFAVGAPYTSVANEINAGLVAIVGGPAGALIDTIPAAAGFDLRGMEFGHSLARLGDLDGDGVSEFAAGAPWYAWIHYIDDNWVGVYSGATRALLWRVEGPPDARFGFSLANAGDVDFDGHDDLLVGDAGHSSVYAYSPARDLQLFQWSSPGHPRYGASVAGGADVNADGWPDFASGAWNVATQPAIFAEASVLTFGCWPDAAYNYCAAVANSTNQRARMQWQNTLSVTANDLRLSADRCPPNKPGLFFYGPSAAELPAGDGHLCVAGGSFRLGVVNTGPTGTPTWSFDVLQPPSPAGQVQPGDTWHFSFWFRDPTGGPAGFNFADGLRATFCP